MKIVKTSVQWIDTINKPSFWVQKDKKGKGKLVIMIEYANSFENQK